MREMARCFVQIATGLRNAVTGNVGTGISVPSENQFRMSRFLANLVEFAE